MIIVGIDPHSRTHAAAAIDEQGRLLESVEVAAGVKGLERLSGWIAALPEPRLVAIENARGYGLALVRRLVAQGEQLVDVPATLTCDGRRGSGQRGKLDEGDALVIARIALRDRERLSRLDASVLDDELKLLVDTRDQLIVEANRWRNRVHALLRAAAPGYQATTGALASAGAIRRARALARRAAGHDPTRGRLAVEALDRLTGLERDAGKLEREIGQLLKARDCSNLLAIRGVGPIVAARSSARPTASAASAARPPSRPTPAQHQSQPRAGVSNATASTVAATASSTARSTRSRSSKPAGSPQPAPTSTESSPKARAPPKPDAAQSATSPTSSTAPSSPTNTHPT